LNSHKTIQVAAAVILDEGDRVLLSLRLKNAHQGGKWEFPGGKIEAGETGPNALKRELKEELNIDISGASEYLQIKHDYADKSVTLNVFLVTSFDGTPKGMEGQEVRWFTLSEMMDLNFPDANYPILEQIRHDYLWAVILKASVNIQLLQKENAKMEWLKSFAQPQVIGPMIGLVAVIGWALNKALSQYFSHVERMEKIRHGIDPDDEEFDEELQ